MSEASFATGIARIAGGVKSRALRRLATAASTFAQEVFCVRIAPTIISNRERPGHQCCGPSASNSARKYLCSVESTSRDATSRTRETLFVTSIFAWTDFGRAAVEPIAKLTIATAKGQVKERAGTKELRRFFAGLSYRY